MSRITLFLLEALVFLGLGWLVVSKLRKSWWKAKVTDKVKEAEAVETAAEAAHELDKKQLKKNKKELNELDEI